MRPSELPGSRHERPGGPAPTSAKPSLAPCFLVQTGRGKWVAPRLTLWKKAKGDAPIWRAATPCLNALKRAASYGQWRCAVHQNANVKALFSPWPVHDSVDNRVSISPEPHAAWLPLRCSANEQPSHILIFCRICADKEDPQRMRGRIRGTWSRWTRLARCAIRACSSMRRDQRSTQWHPVPGDAAGTCPARRSPRPRGRTEAASPLLNPPHGSRSLRASCWSSLRSSQCFGI